MLRTAHPVASIPDVLSSKLRLNDKSSAEEEDDEEEESDEEEDEEEEVDAKSKGKS